MRLIYIFRRVGTTHGVISTKDPGESSMVPRIPGQFPQIYRSCDCVGADFTQGAFNLDYTM
jgi:hypothetical protein